MNTVWNFFSDATWQTLATALLHTLWQGVLISFVLFFCLKLLPTNRPRARYAASLTAMLCLLLGSLATWATLDYFATEREAAPARTVIFVPAQSETSASAASATVSGESHSIASIPEPGSTPDTQQSWDYRPLILLAWLTGVGLMLIRLVNQLKDTGHLEQQCRSLDNPELIRMTEELRRALGISRRVRLLITEKLTSPAAVGALWPIILLPASLATGTPPETIRAILAHELAHIRRHDYVINLAQMLIETVLFFNPAVWWISRQIRIEREACCDKLAVQISGDDIQYAQALSDFASKHGLSVGLPMPAMAFGQERSPGSLLDRVKRILIPGYQPHLRLPWLGMFTFLLIGGLTLFALQQGTQLAVTATAKLLTPKERIEKIEQIQKTHSVKKPYAEFTKEQLSAPDSKVTVSGIVRMDDGSPFDQRRFQFHASSQQPNYSAGYTFSVNKDNTFSTKVRPGNIYLTTRSEDYAPTFVGPLDGKPGAVIEDVEIVLSPGFESSIQVMDATGRPIAGARFKGRYDFPDGVALPELVSDERGRIELANCAPLPAKLELWVEGYQHDYRVETFLPEQTVQWSLKKGVSTRIRILSSITGKPIVNANVELISGRGPKAFGTNPGYGNQLGQSDADGIVEVNQLRDDSAYWLLINAAGYERKFVERVMPGQAERTIKLGPEIVVAGEITGDLDQLRKRRSGLYMSYSNPYQLEGGSHSSWKNAPVEVRDGKGYFRITNLWAGSIELGAADTRFDQELSHSLTNLVLKLAARNDSPDADANDPKVTRKVVYRFKTPAGHPVPTGKLNAVYLKQEYKRHYNTENRMLEITNGVAEMTIQLPAKVGYKSDGLAGYWIGEEWGKAVPPGEQPFFVDIEAHPAGAIYGTITEADGSPARSTMISVTEVERSPYRKNRSLGVTVKNGASGEGDFIEKFAATPLPLGGTYMIVAHRGNTYAVSEAIKLTAKTPLANVAMIYGPTIDVKGRILKLDGSPAAGIRYSHSFSPSSGSSYSTGDKFADRNGRFTVEDINPAVAGTYRIYVQKNPGYQPAMTEYSPGKQEIIFRLKAGKTVRGRVLDDATGWPIPGIEVYALPRPYNEERSAHGHFDADKKTDETGAFVFTTLDGNGYELGVRDAQIVTRQGPEVSGGPTESVTIRVKLYEWSTQKPAPPAKSAKVLE